MKQLEFDFGMLTVEQEAKVNRFIANQAEYAAKNKAAVESEIQLLINAGFCPGYDFASNFESKLVTEDHDFGYREDAFTANITYQNCSGGVYIIAKSVKLDENDQAIRSERKIHFRVERDYKGSKIECYQLVGSYRAVKPETLFTKLMEYNQQQEDGAINELERRIAKRNGIAKLQAQYPQATEVRETEQYINRNYRKMVSVSFAL